LGKKGLPSIGLGGEGGFWDRVRHLGRTEKRCGHLKRDLGVFEGNEEKRCTINSKVQFRKLEKGGKPNIVMHQKKHEKLTNHFTGQQTLVI